MSEYLCNLIVPGFAKCGTSSLHYYLNQHPNIEMSSVKEPHHFSIRERFEMGAESHNLLFGDKDPPGTVYGESSTSYSVWEPAQDRIKASLEDPKLILLIREPFARLVSHYNWMWALGLETLPIIDAVNQELQQPYDICSDRNGCYPWYVRCSSYSKFVPRIENAFGSKNLLIINSDELRNEPRRALKRCFSFLDIRDFDVLPDKRMNVTEEIMGARFERTRDVLRNLIPLSLRSKLDPNQTLRSAMKNRLGRKRRTPPSMTEMDRKQLKEMLQAEIEFYNRTRADHELSDSIG